jgi:hypothetical protein
MRSAALIRAPSQFDLPLGTRFVPARGVHRAARIRLLPRTCVL